MTYAAVLAGGSGLRMGGCIPKQFLSVGGRPVIIRSIDAFVHSGVVDKIFVAVSEDYVSYMEKLLAEYIPEIAVEIIIGGKNRNDTLYNVLKKIIPSDDDIILTHDAVRPFIDDRIIMDNIESARQYGACNTVVPAVDTILVSEDGKFIDSVPDRKTMFHAQTPQSFNVKKLLNFYESMTEDELENYTDACTVFIMNGEKVSLVTGDRNNIKLTYPEDMEKAETIIKKRGANK